MTTYNYHMPADLNITQGGGDTPNARVSTNLTTPIEGRTGGPTLYKALTEKTAPRFNWYNPCTRFSISDANGDGSIGWQSYTPELGYSRFGTTTESGGRQIHVDFSWASVTTLLGRVEGAPVFATTATFDQQINVNGGIGPEGGGKWGLSGEPIITKTDQGQCGGCLAFNTPHMSHIAASGDSYVTLSTKTNAVQIGPTDFEPPTRLQFVFCGNGGPPTRLERNGVSVVVLNPANISQAVPLLISPEICKTEARLKELALADHLKVGQHVLLLPDPPTTAGVHYTQEVYIVPWDDATYDDLIKIAFKTITV